MEARRIMEAERNEQLRLYHLALAAAEERFRDDWRGRSEAMVAAHREFSEKDAPIRRRMEEAEARMPQLVDELTLARERAAMNAEDLQSFMAQRYYTGSMQIRVRSGERLQSWQELYEVRDGNYDQMADAMREVRLALRARNWERVAEIVADELGSDSGEDAEEEAPETDVEMEVPEAALALQQEIASALQPSSAPTRAWFTGTVHRLGD